jgi:hypothetical protein
LSGECCCIGPSECLYVLHSGQSSRTCSSGVWSASWHAHLPSGCSGRYVGGRWWLSLFYWSEVGCPGHCGLSVTLRVILFNFESCIFSINYPKSYWIRHSYGLSAIP